MADYWVGCWVELTGLWMAAGLVVYLADKWADLMVVDWVDWKVVAMVVD